jgi:hypothetical protein
MVDDSPTRSRPRFDPRFSPEFQPGFFPDLEQRGAAPPRGEAAEVRAVGADPTHGDAGSAEHEPTGAEPAGPKSTGPQPERRWAARTGADRDQLSAPNTPTGSPPDVPVASAARVGPESRDRPELSVVQQSEGGASSDPAEASRASGVQPRLMAPAVSVANHSVIGSPASQTVAADRQGNNDDDVRDRDGNGNGNSNSNSNSGNAATIVTIDTPADARSGAWSGPAALWRNP